MFILSTLSDTIFIPSSSFTRVDPSSSASSSAQIAPTSLSSLSQALNAKYANRVIPDVGLCICLFDVLEASEGRVKWGDGGLWHKCRFRLAVFRPFVGEVLVGKVMSSDEGGIRVSMGFFDDIHIPLHLLPSPHAFDHKERAHFWLFDPSHPSYITDPITAPDTERFYLDQHEAIRFVVEDDIFEEGEPPLPAGALKEGEKAGDKAGTSGGGSGAIGGGVTMEAMEAARAKRKPPYRITASIAGQGLGLINWWMGAAAVGDEGGEEGEQYDEGDEVMQE
ncbi:hypothetical protein BDZ90DRAFT_252890 [Jaminaea rosea]|uniref:Polymerase III polypeptide H n=1 Tax=Jaminaea rosea TaxID=1569628 RepID=A0A316UNU9_9BASI|nr:hypothetical protein BDZ90DRAFT_252890 [Jaminaea rosea]PWN26982.1 hypothetical protein BDZ90DRAFT_252890 [Jaminaea rosea]